MRVATLLLAGGLAAACAPEPESVVPLYDSATVEPRHIEVSVDAAGVIEPETTVELKSKASGEILAVHADTGDVIEAGTLLVEVEKRTPRNRLAEAQAQLLAAQARRKIAETAMLRAERLHESGTLTQTDFEQTQLEFANAEAQVVASEVAVENARISLDEADVRAPITGTVIEKAVEPGMVISSPTQAASGGTVLMKMADLTAVRVRTLVDETDIGKIRPGMPAKVTVAAYPNQPFDGEVLKIEPQAIVEQNVTMFAVLIRLENRGGLLRPGMNADVRISIASREGVPAVPTAALRADADIPATAQMLGLAEDVLRNALGPALGGDLGEERRVLAFGGRELRPPPGIEPAQIAAVMAKRRSGQELSDAERALLRRVMEAGGFNGGGFGGGAASGGLARGGGANGGPQVFRGGADGAASGTTPPRDGDATARTPSISEYQFEGNYWALVLRDGRVVPVRVQTGLTDLRHSEVRAGLDLGDEVLLLPTSSLFEQQAQLRQFISQRFGGSPFQQRGGPPGGAIIFR